MDSDPWVRESDSMVRENDPWVRESECSESGWSPEYLELKEIVRVVEAKGLWPFLVFVFPSKGNRKTRIALLEQAINLKIIKKQEVYFVLLFATEAQQVSCSLPVAHQDRGILLGPHSKFMTTTSYHFVSNHVFTTTIQFFHHTHHKNTFSPSGEGGLHFWRLLFHKNLD